MGKHSPKTEKSHQEVYDLYDKIKSELPEAQRNHTKPSYYIEIIIEKTMYAESSVRQILSNRYKKSK